MIATRQGKIGRLNSLHLGMWATLITLLVCPLVMMQFTDEVRWSASDFAAAAALLIGLGVAAEFALRISRPAIRVTVTATAILAAMLIWAEGAVGLF